MNLEQFNAHCLAKPGVEATFPFKGVIVAPFHFIKLKCDPERAEQLRESHAAIRPG